MPAQRRRRKKREKEKKEKKKNAHEENQLDLSHKTAETKEKCTSATTNTPKMSSSESIDLDSTTTTPRKDIKREATPLTSNDNTLAHSFDTNESNVMPKSLIVSVQEETRDKRHKYADVAFPVNGADFDTRGVILSDPDISYTCYQGEHQLASLTALIEKDLSEPYSIYTYRYFTNNWPDLTFLAMSGGACVGTIVCKLAPNDNTGKMEGYIAMLAVDKSYRKRAIGSTLVCTLM